MYDFEDFFCLFVGYVKMASNLFVRANYNSWFMTMTSLWKFSDLIQSELSIKSREENLYSSPSFRKPVQWLPSYEDLIREIWFLGVCVRACGYVTSNDHEGWPEYNKLVKIRDKPVNLKKNVR